MNYELFPNYAPRPPLPRKVGGHDPPAPMGAPPLITAILTSGSIEDCGAMTPSSIFFVSNKINQLITVICIH